MLGIVEVKEHGRRKPRFSFEELWPALNKWASHYSRETKGKYEFWELVDEAWLGEAKYLSDIKLSWGRVKFDMIDYMRTRDRDRQRRRNKGFPRMLSLDKSTSNANNFAYRDIIEDKHNYVGRIDDDEEIRELLKGLSREERLIVNLLFVADCTQEEVARVIPFSPSRISQILKNILQRLKIKAVDMNLLKSQVA